MARLLLGLGSILWLFVQTTSAEPSVHVKGLDVTYDGYLDGAVEQFRDIHYGEDHMRHRP